jgi:hypothetical protein
MLNWRAELQCDSLGRGVAADLKAKLVGASTCLARTPLWPVRALRTRDLWLRHRVIEDTAAMLASTEGGRRSPVTRLERASAKAGIPALRQGSSATFRGSDLATSPSPLLAGTRRGFSMLQPSAFGTHHRGACFSAHASPRRDQPTRNTVNPPQRSGPFDCASLGWLTWVPKQLLQNDQPELVLEPFTVTPSTPHGLSSSAPYQLPARPPFRAETHCDCANCMVANDTQ